MHATTEIVAALQARGVQILAPASVYVDPAIPHDRVASGVTIYPGCRILGAETSIGPGCTLGKEGPLTLENSQLQANVAVGGGFVTGATLLAGVTLGADVHIRPGTLLEEQATCGHAVGLKQTILLPFVTTGSLINFCDCLMAGGTDRRHHSEVGSSYIHFNYTPNQDKATPSLIGDVPRGVMLDQPPIFLGGQGGLVGPARIEYGTVVAAGTILRGDQLEGHRLVFGHRKEGERPLTPGVYLSARRLVANNLIAIGNLHALRHWYTHVRTRFMRDSPFDAACLHGAQARLETVLRDRIQRLGEVAERLGRPPEGNDLRAEAERRFQGAFAANWETLLPRLDATASAQAGAESREAFLEKLDDTAAGARYLEAVRAFAPASRRLGTAWLQAVVDAVAGLTAA